jgi:5-methylcytosine-specific restriction enzyme subunit McrC
MLAEVTPTTMPASAIGGFRYHQLNDDYRQLHQLCRLFLEGASVSEDAGPFDFQTCLVDMNKLFEVFMTKLLRDRAYARMAASAQERVCLGHEKKVLVWPDIARRRGGVVALIAD